MNTRLPRLSWLLLALAITGAGYFIWQRKLDRNGSPATGAAEYRSNNTDDKNLASQNDTVNSVERSKQDSRGNALLASAKKMVASRSGIAARVRMRVRLYETEILGSGDYLQKGNGLLDSAKSVRFRWKLRTQIGKETSSFLQVSNGRFLWTDRSLPSGQKITRIDLRRLERGARSESREAPIAQMPPNLFDLGGLPQLLGSLNRYYQFGAPKRATLLDLPVYVLAGKLKDPKEIEQALQRNAPELQNDAMPKIARVFLGQDDLFIYQLEYYVGKEISEKGIKSSDPGIIIQWYDVQLDGPVDEGKFDYAPPSGFQWEDITGSLLEPEKE